MYRTCAIGQLRATVQAPVSGNEARVAGWGMLAGPVVSVIRKWPRRLSALVGWHCGATTQCAGVDRRALCVHRAAGAPSSEAPSASFISITSVRPCLLRTAEMGWRVGGQTYPIRSRGPNQGRTSLEIVYAAWHTCAPSLWRCDVCMPFDTSDGPR